MKALKQIFFMTVLTIGLSGAVFAQKDDRRRPPKEKPPVVTPGGPKKPPPKEGRDKPKKPQMSWFVLLKEDNESIA
jgi:hypothetical protein